MSNLQLFTEPGGNGGGSGEGESIGLIWNGPGSQVSGIMRYDHLFCGVWSDWLCMYWQKRCHGDSNESSGQSGDHCLWSSSVVSSGADGVWFRGVSCRTDICHRFVVRVSLYVCGMGGKYPSVCENDSLTDGAVATILKEMICLGSCYG